MQAILLALGVAAFLAALLGFSAMYDAHASRVAGGDFGAAAGVYVATLKASTLLAERLSAVRWRTARRVGINHGRFVLASEGLKWTPSFLTGRKVPSFAVAWNEVRNYSVTPGPKLIGRRVAYLTLDLVDGTPLRFATVDPDGLSVVLARLRP